MPLEVIKDPGGTNLALLITSIDEFPLGHNFLTHESDPLQFAIFNHPTGHQIQRHWHPPVDRQLTTTSEVLVVQSGRVLVSIYDVELNPVLTREMSSGDVAVLFSGGHGFKILENATILEVKQGPYAGEYDKVLF
jgi:hypothetical protein